MMTMLMMITMIMVMMKMVNDDYYDDVTSLT